MRVTLSLPGAEMIRGRRGQALAVHIEQERAVLGRIADGHSLSSVLNDLLLGIEQASGKGVTASILELSEDGEHLNHLAGSSLPAAFKQAIDGVQIGEGVGSCGTVVYRNAPVYVADIENDPLWTDYRAVALAHNLRACWSTPIKGMDGNMLGTFAIYYDVPRTPRPADLEAISAVTLIVALAIERHRAKQDISRLRRELESLRGVEKSL